MQGNRSVLCFGKFPVATKFIDKKGEGEQKTLLSNFFYVTVPKNFVGKLFSVSLGSGNGKLYASGGYVTIFCWIFLSHNAEKFRR